VRTLGALATTGGYLSHPRAAPSIDATTKSCAARGVQHMAHVAIGRPA
jgi:hypothetical protein